jgi:hypothetical protein
VLLLSGRCAAGTWVNGGVWTTTEGRWLMAAARTGDIAPAVESVRRMLKLFGSTWRMDNPIVKFGLEPCVSHRFQSHVLLLIQ